MSNTPNFRTTFYGATKGVEETADLLKLSHKGRKHNKKHAVKHQSEPAAVAAESAEAPKAAEATKPAAGQAAKGAVAVSPPEKVHTLDPEAWQHEANTNKPNKRTTFYHKNGVKK